MRLRHWQILLLGSLMCNAFLLGGAAGAAWQWLATHGHISRAAPPSQTHALRFAARGLSLQRQQEFMAVLKAAHRDAGDSARQGREGRRDVLDLLAAPKLNRVALDAALEHTREADMTLRTRIEQGVADFAASLTPDERARFAAALRRDGEWRQADGAPATQRLDKPHARPQ
ncbi:periplasmic heavy metal sensor [Martelella alba]|uniref:Periplasmic heavy metal sensor n=1 Tax=Martelella alba TaxID=2590451 RepID=A0ABY2SHU0_9HYPH|nr:periplasmic heavy metal sensor [Martelella alba]TKI04591.1 periplasmic heavy metal sensor [Martelella alba]